TESDIDKELAKEKHDLPKALADLLPKATDPKRDLLLTTMLLNTVNDQSELSIARLKLLAAWLPETQQTKVESATLKRMVGMVGEAAKKPSGDRAAAPASLFGETKKDAQIVRLAVVTAMLGERSAICAGDAADSRSEPRAYPWIVAELGAVQQSRHNAELQL